MEMPTYSSCFHVHDRTYMFHFVGKHAERVAKQVLNKKYIIVSMESKINNSPVAAEQNYVPSSLIEIYKFDEMVKRLERRNAGHILIFSTGSSKEVQDRVVFLIGCTLIMSKTLGVSEVCRIFDRIDILRQNNSNKKGAIDCWNALYQAKRLAWLDFSEPFDRDCADESIINIEELIHYSRKLAIITLSMLPNESVLRTIYKQHGSWQRDSVCNYQNHTSKNLSKLWVDLIAIIVNMHCI